MTYGGGGGADKITRRHFMKQLVDTLFKVNLPVNDNCYNLLMSSRVILRNFMKFRLFSYINDHFSSN